MGLEKVIQRVEQSGDEQIKKILAEAEQQADEILAKKRKTLDEHEKRRRQDIKRQIAQVRMQEESSLELEAKRLRLNAEKELLERTRNECLELLTQQPQEPILRTLLEKVHEELPDAVFVYTNTRDEPLIRRLSSLTFAGTLDCLGGIVVENQDRTLRLDYRFETIASTLWDRHLKEIADALFR